MFYGQKIAVVIPAFRVEKWIKDVIRGIPEYIDGIIVVDDCSPDKTAEVVGKLRHPKVKLIRHNKNQGVGGAIKTGFAEAMHLGMDIVVKMDGDNQMDPAYLPALLFPIVKDECDYTKGNRFNLTENQAGMPAIRKIGNQFLTFLTKFASGYWHIFDPQNGYLAIRTATLRKLCLDWIDDTYFFENSMLINLNIIEAKASDIYIPSRYGDEKSSMNIYRILRQFPYKLIKGFFSRVFYRYVYLDISPIFIMLSTGSILLTGGIVWGVIAWYESIFMDRPVDLGTMVLGLVPILLGFQTLLNGLTMDIQATPCGKRKVYDFTLEELGDIEKKGQPEISGND